MQGLVLSEKNAALVDRMWMAKRVGLHLYCSMNQLLLHAVLVVHTLLFRTHLG
jgi:hypothetical protein